MRKWESGKVGEKVEREPIHLTHLVAIVELIALVAIGLAVLSPLHTFLPSL